MKSDAEFLLTERFGGEKNEAFFTACKRLALGEPLGYLIGHVPFLDCTIWLDARPLVPRVETEWWVEKAIAVVKEWKMKQPGLGISPNSAAPPRILDLCAGSGCVGVAAAKAIPEALVDFAEIDRHLLPTIRKNIIANLAKPDRCQIFHSNLFTNLPAEASYDFILSNPPYLDPVNNQAEPAVRQFEPAVALYGGRRGIDIIKQIIAAAATYLTSSGQLWIEHDPEQKNIIATIAGQYNFRISTHSDQYNVPRYSILVLE